MFSSWTVIILIYMIQSSDTTDPCDDYTSIADPIRSTGYIRNATEATIQICDNLLEEGWYRSVGFGGNEMPNQCPSLFSCGSAGSIWMALPEADRPAVNTTVTRKACLADLFDCCSKEYDIEVRNCYDDYFIYKLVPVTGCPEAYCFGTEAPCPDGESSENGYSPGCGIYPSTNVTGTVVPGLRTRAEPEGRSKLLYEEVTFQCDFTQEATESYIYDVFWYINDRTIPIVKFQVSIENLTSAILLEEHWKETHKMNMVVWCSTRVRHNVSSSPSPHFWSNGFTAGIKYDKIAYSVKESQTTSIGIELTVPLPCQKRSSETLISTTDEELKALCILNVLTVVPLYQTDPTKTCNADGTSVDPDGLVFNNQGCGVHFTASDWTKQTSFNVTGKVDSLYNLENRITSIRIHTMYYLQNSVWEDIIVPDVKVAVIDTEHTVSGKMCRSYNDPHITPIEGSNFDHFIPGEFILYKSTRFPYQVNAIFRTCWSATCHCGVAVKNADGLFVINMCPQNLGGWGSPSLSSTTRINRYVEKRFCDDTHMTMRREGSNYRVTLPTGTEIYIRVGNPYIDSVTIKPSVLDYENTVGICGPFGTYQQGMYILLDKTVTTDINTFKRHYKVPKEDSLFALDWTPDPSDLLVYSEKYCICREETEKYPVDSNYILCELKNPSETCTSNTTEEKEVFFTECTRSRRSVHDRRMKRDTFDEIAIEKFPIEDFPIDDFEEPVFNWANGWTEETARVYCEEAFVNSSAYSICSENVPVINATGFIMSCVTDIKIVGNTSFVQVTLDAYKTSCSAEARMMESLQTTNSSTKGNGSSLLDDLLEKTCPNECSGNGICKNGGCQCQSGFFGYSCSQEENSRPVLETDSMSGTCDSSSRPCNSLLIYGSGFNPDKIQCLFRKIEITENGTTIANSSTINDGQYMNEFCVQCSPPESRKKRSTSSNLYATGYMISVGNGDGSGGYTDEFPYLIYDSQCYDCNVTTLDCVEKSGCPLSSSTSSTLQSTSDSSSTSSSSSTSTTSSSSSSTPSMSSSTSSFSSASMLTTSSSTSTSLPLSTSTISSSDSSSTTGSTAPFISSTINITDPATTAGIDPCVTYTNLTGDVTRSVAWIWNSGDTATCDYLLTEQWYRIQSAAGNEIVSACPPTDRCGTNSPVWMNGSIPNFGDGLVERDVCVSGLFDCCESTWKIKLKHCGSFISYYLPRTNGCPQAYCFGTLLITTTPQTTQTTTTSVQTSYTTTSSVTTTDADYEGNTKKHKVEDSGDRTIIIAIVVIVTIVGLAAVIISVCYVLKKKKNIKGSRIDLQRENTSGSFTSVRPQSAASARSIDIQYDFFHDNEAYVDNFIAKANNSAPPTLSLFQTVKC